MGFLRQEYWRGLPFLSPGIKPASPALAGRFFTTEPSGKDLPELYPFKINWWPGEYNAYLSSVSHSSKLLQPWEEADNLDCDWHLNRGGGWGTILQDGACYLWIRCCLPVELSWITGHSAGVWELLVGVRKPPNSLYWTWVQNLLAVYKQPHSFRIRNISYATCVPAPFFLLRLFP